MILTGRSLKYSWWICQVRLAAAVASRASKDVSDSTVYGLLPTAKALSKVAAQRAAERIAETMGTSTGKTRYYNTRVITVETDRGLGFTLNPFL